MSCTFAKCVSKTASKISHLGFTFQPTANSLYLSPLCQTDDTRVGVWRSVSCIDSILTRREPHKVLNCCTYSQSIYCFIYLLLYYIYIILSISHSFTSISFYLTHSIIISIVLSVVLYVIYIEQHICCSLSVGHSESRRMTDEIGISPERPIHFECN